jgi:hemoglobin
MESIYDKYGGEKFWQVVIDDFYQRNITDPKLQTFFEGKDVERIKRMNKHLLTAALQGSEDYSNLGEVRGIHCNFGIKLDHFNRFLLNIYNVLTSHGVSEEDSEYILVVIEAFREDVVV